MTLEEIKQAIADGKTVHWSHEGYVVTKHHLIHCLSNDSCIGLTHQDGITMNGKEEDFFLGE